MISTIADRNEVPPTARLFWVGHYFRIKATYLDRYELECVDGYDLRRTLPRAHVAALKHCGDLDVEPYYYDLSGKPAGTSNAAALLHGQPMKEQRFAMVHFIVGNEAIKDYGAGKVALYETRLPDSNRRRRQTGKVTLDVWLAENSARLYKLCRPYFLLDPDAPQALEKPRRGQPGPPELGSASSLKKTIQKMRRKGFKITDLLRDVEGMRNGGRKMAPDMAAFVRAQIRTFLLRPERPSMAMFRRHLRATLNDMPAMKHRSVPSPGAIENLIEDLPDARVIASLFGIDVMEHQRTIRSKGPEFTRIGERIIMDCWKIDQVSLVKTGDGWMLVNEDLEEEWGVRRRLWICAAIDACSRAILGFSLGYSENSDLTVNTLRMVVSDKTLWAADAGCKAPPPPPVTPESILTDAGDAFTPPQFHMRALQLTKDVDIGPAGKKHLRGMKERFFRSIKEMVLAYFTGTTFGNVVAKGDYDSMGRASLEVGDLGRGLFRYINDVYHLSSHRGLDEQPPIDRFNETYGHSGAADLLTDEEIKVVFGIDIELPVTHQGCWFAGHHYWSGTLGVHFANKRIKRIRAKVDPLNLGRLIGWIDGAWVTLAGPPHMHRVGMTGWLQTYASLKAKHRAQAAIHYDIVAAALRRLEQMGTKARLEARVLDLGYDSESIAKAANGVRIRFVERANPTTPGALLAIGSSSREASYETLFDPDDLLAMPIVDQDEDAPAVREETDLGLDDANIDQDGEIIEADEDEAVPVDQEQRPKPKRIKPPPAPRPPPQPLDFLPAPKRKDQ